MVKGQQRVPRRPTAVWRLVRQTTSPVATPPVEVRLPWHHNGSDIVQFQHRAPGFIAGNVHMVRLDLEMERSS